MLSQILVPVVVLQGRLQLALASRRKAKRDGMPLELSASLGIEGSCGLGLGFRLVKTRRVRIARPQGFYPWCIVMIFVSDVKNGLS